MVGKGKESMSVQSSNLANCERAELPAFEYIPEDQGSRQQPDIASSTASEAILPLATPGQLPSTPATQPCRGGNEAGLSPPLPRLAAPADPRGGLPTRHASAKLAPDGHPLAATCPAIFSKGSTFGVFL